MNVTTEITHTANDHSHRTWLYRSNDLMWTARDAIAEALAALPRHQFSGGNSVSRGSASDIRVYGARYEDQVRLTLQVSKATGGWILAVDAVTEETSGALLDLVVGVLESRGLPFYTWKFVWGVV